MELQTFIEYQYQKIISIFKVTYITTANVNFGENTANGIILE